MDGELVVHGLHVDRVRVEEPLVADASHGGDDQRRDPGRVGIGADRAVVLAALDDPGHVGDDGCRAQGELLLELVDGADRPLEDQPLQSPVGHRVGGHPVADGPDQCEQLAQPVGFRRRVLEVGPPPLTEPIDQRSQQVLLVAEPGGDRPRLYPARSPVAANVMPA